MLERPHRERCPGPTEWANLGGKSTSAEGDPVLVAPGVGKLVIAVLGDDGQLYYRMRDL